MSRIGRLAIPVPSGVDVKLEGSRITVKGPKGELTRQLTPELKVVRDDGALRVERPSDEKRARELHGLTRTLIANMITGVTSGYRKGLEITGVGYRAQLVGRKLQLNLGYSHPIEIEPPAGISFEIENPTRLSVVGVDKELVGHTAARIRASRKPEPYKGKGVKYAGEQIRRKAGKAGKIGAKK
jgi:large subunit ribosomal protein L6